jgi:hypothetical protein
MNPNQVPWFLEAIPKIKDESLAEAYAARTAMALKCRCLAGS